MPTVQPSLLRSQFLLDVKGQFSRGLRLWVEMLEFEEEPSESLLDESLEVLLSVIRGHDLFVYQTLTIWGDHVATYTVRETVRKRMYRLVHQVREFPLIAEPAKIVQAFEWAGHELRSMSVPPGVTQDDRELLQRIEQRWLDLSTALAH